MNLEDVVQNEDAMAKEFCDEQNLKKYKWGKNKTKKNMLKYRCDKKNVIQIWDKIHKLKF